MKSTDVKNISIKVEKGGNVTVFSEMRNMNETAAILMDAFIHTLMTGDLDNFLDVVMGARKLLDDCFVNVCKAIIENTDLIDDEADEEDYDED